VELLGCFLEKRQYFGWSNWQENKWNSLTAGQREYLIKNDIA